MIKSKIEVQTINSKAFDDYRNFISDEFTTERIFFKRKLTQGAFWTSLDKDLANQYFREERWLFGFKYRDELKLIDHGVNDIKSNKLGF